MDVWVEVEDGALVNEVAKADEDIDTVALLGLVELLVAAGTSSITELDGPATSGGKL